MVRLPRLVLPGYPYHVTQRGNRRQQTFFEDGDYLLYRDLLAEAARRAGAEIWPTPDAQPHPCHRRALGRGGLRRTLAVACTIVNPKLTTS